MSTKTPMHDASHSFHESLARRDFLGRVSCGLAGIALSTLLPADGQCDSLPTHWDTLPKTGHHPPRAKSVIQLFMHGGPSQMDLLDPKPMLDRYDGQKFPGAIDVQETDKAGGVLRSPYRFEKSGQSGIEVSELLPHLSKSVDEICLIRSMHTEHINHEPALWMMHTGETIPGRPAWGSWVTYGLGSESQDLPAYVVLDDPKGLPVDGIRNWSSGWLPPLYQGTRFRSEGTAVWNLAPHKTRTQSLQQSRRELLQSFDLEHKERHPDEAELDARIASYALAARMQRSAADALDLSQESQATQQLYGLDNPTTSSFGRRCLMARRLVERGVRFVQIFLESQIWDHHSAIRPGLVSACGRTDQPSAALLTDLKQRGLLDETLVFWGGEFGRLPISQSTDGRDHNHRGFSLWLAGGGVRAGHVHGATDEFGYAAVEQRVSVRDLHATMLHQLGLDHRRLAYHRNGLDERLTGIHHPRVVTEILS